MTSPLWISEREVVELVSLADAIEAVEDGYRAEHLGLLGQMAKTHAAWDGHGTLHALGAVAPCWGLIGTKTWAHTPGGACPLLVLFDSKTGGLSAIIEAFALGQMRTAAATGVATRAMAVPDADVLAQIGTGKQALAQVAAVDAVRRLAEVRVYSPTPENRAAFAVRVSDELGIPARACEDLAQATEGATIITAATRATTPFLFATGIETPVHVNAIGAITPERRELDPDLVERADLRVADNVDVAIRLSPEFGDLRRADPEATFLSLAEVLASPQLVPRAGITLFKAMGTGLADIAVGKLVLERARRVGVGRTVHQPLRMTPRLRNNQRGRL